MKKAHPKASILKGSRAVFNIRCDPMCQNDRSLRIRRPVIDRPVCDDDHRQRITEPAENREQVRKTLGASAT